MGDVFLDNLVIFLEGKDEPYNVTSGYSKWATILQRTHSLEIKRCFLDNLEPDDLERTVLLISVGPRQAFSAAEFEAIQTFRNLGINILFLVGEGGQEELKTNVNHFLSPLGLEFARDCVVRRMHSKYFHPKQALISDALLENSLLLAGNVDTRDCKKLEFVYPFGCTIEVSPPAIPVLTSGNCCFPVSRAICGLSVNDSETGKIICFGSLFAFHDQFIDCEENTQLLNRLILMILTPNEDLLRNPKRFAEAGDIAERPPRSFITPHSFRLLPVFDGLFDEPDVDKLESVGGGPEEYGARLQVEAMMIKAARKLGVSWDLDSVQVPPPLEGYLPPMVFPIPPPTVRIPCAPFLELFDLDEEFLSDEERLQTLCSKEMDPQRLLVEAAETFRISLQSDITSSLRSEPERILKHIVESVIGEAHDLEDAASMHSTLNQTSQDKPGILDIKGDLREEPKKFNLEAACEFIGKTDSSATDAELLDECIKKRLKTAQKEKKFSDRGRSSSSTRRCSEGGNYSESARSRSSFPIEAFSITASRPFSSLSTHDRDPTVDIWRPLSRNSFSSTSSRIDVSPVGHAECDAVKPWQGFVVKG